MRLSIGGAKRDSVLGPRPHPPRRPPPDSVVPQTARSSSPTHSFESHTMSSMPALPTRLGSSYLTKPPNFLSEKLDRDRSDSHSSIRSRNSGSASATMPGPDFYTIPIRWRGLTMDAAKWTMTSEELQDMVREAIQHSAKASSIKLLHPEVLKNEVPIESERLEQVMEQIQRKYRAQVRRRRVLFKSLSLYIDGSDPGTARRLTDELVDATATCDALAEELYQVTDQLAQVRRLYDNHYTSALAMALRKINGSLLKKDKQNKELRDKIASLEAEREYAWNVAKTVEEEAQSVHELMVAASNGSTARSSSVTNSPLPPSLDRSNSRVEAARKGAARISQASLHINSSRRSLRSSFGSNRFSSRPSSSSHLPVPPVPPVPLTAVTLQSIRSEARAQTAASPVSSLAETLDEAQAALMDLLGIVSNDLQPNRRRSASFCSPRRSGYSSSSRDDNVIHVRSSSGSLQSNLTRRHSLSALKPSDDPLLKSQFLA